MKLLRTAIAACLLTLAALSGGCARGGDTTVRVLGPWTGDEAKAFERTLKQLDDGTGRTYTYEGTRSLRETLVAQLEAGDPPDVAILNSIGELSEYARKHKAYPLQGQTLGAASPPWALTLPVDGSRHTYWVPLKVDLKSLVWSRKGTPSTNPKWCVGMSSEATSGWPGTDWIEDILLHQSGPEVYTRWATGQQKWDTPEVRGAFTTWSQLLGHPTPASITESLTMPYEGTPDPERTSKRPRGLLASMHCTHEHQSAFVRYLYPQNDVRWEPSARYLPGPPDYDETYEVSGDMAAVFKNGPAAQDLVRQLSSEQGRTLWMAKAAATVRPLFPSPGDPLPTDPIGEQVARRLSGSDEEATRLCFDASDVMPPQLRDAFFRAVLEYFSKPAQSVKPLMQQLDKVQRRISQASGPEAPPPLEGICARPGG